ncbi:hypothetical protein ATE47_18130 [Chryseobacterium sp. IHB B 17019]|jgi:hypothetical protein|nr:hypothetical protein ATE47_18130 [Chryseobacterium sp. IHB B 17019]
MQKIVNFIEKNELEIRLSFYLIVINIVWINFVVYLFSQSNLPNNVGNYSLWIPSIFFIIYIIIKSIKSSEFLLFPPIRFFCFYFLFQTLLFDASFSRNYAILNRQKYDNLDKFIIETYNDSKEIKVTLLEKIFNKLFK